MDSPQQAGEDDPASGDRAAHWLPDGRVEGPAPQRVLPDAKSAGRNRTIAVAMTALGACVLVLLAVVVGEWAARTATVDRLVSQIERSEAAMMTAMAAVSTVVAQEGASSENLAEQTSADLRQAAGIASDEVAAAAQEIAAQPVQPWHHDIVQAREAYLAHSAAWLAYLGRAEQDAGAWFAPDPEIERTWADFVPHLAAIVPTPAIASLPQRVEAILDEGEAPVDTGDTLQADWRRPSGGPQWATAGPRA